MTKSKQRQSLRGAVLIMILTVMVVLIIMLMATLTVVTTAGQRIYTKFEENQAYYSARSALDVFTQDMLADGGYYAYDNTGIRMYDYTDYSDPANPVVKTGANGAKMKQGLALQGELYKIKSQGVATKEFALELAKTDSSLGITSANAAEALKFVENMYVSDDVFGDVGGTDCPENTFFSVSDTAINSDTDTSKQKDYIEYKVTLPKTGNGSNQYGMMVDVDDTTSEQLATIRVEVLDRFYHTSPGYDRETAIKTVLKGTPAEKQALKDAIKAGDRSKDIIKLKITSTVTFMDTEGTAVLIYDSSEPKTVASSRAVTSLSGTASGDGMFPIGGVSTLTDMKIGWGNGSAATGSLYFQGDYDVRDTEMHLDDTAMVYVKGNMETSNGLPIVHDAGSAIFVGETLNFNNVNGYLAGAGKEINVIAKRITANQQNMEGIYGKVFCEEFDVTAFKNTYAVSQGVHTNYIMGDVNVTNDTGTTLNVDITLPTLTNYGGLNLTFSQSDVLCYSSTVTGTGWGARTQAETRYEILYDTVTQMPKSCTKVYNEQVYDNTNALVSETETITTYAGSVISVDNLNGDVSQFQSPNRSGDVDIDITDYTNNPVVNGEREYDLPGAIIDGFYPAGSKVTIPTLETLYGEYFKSGTFDTNGEFAVSYTSTDPAVRRTELDAYIQAQVITAEDKLGVTTLDKYASTAFVTVEPRNAANEATYPVAEQIPAVFTKVITGSGRLQTVDNNGNGLGQYGLIAIDARTNPVEIQLGGDEFTSEQHYTGKFVVFGDKDVTFYVAGNQNAWLGGTTGSCVFEVYSKELYDITEAGGTIVAGPKASNPTNAPNINFYVASTVPNLVTGHQAYTCAYFYMPKTVFDFGGGANGKAITTTYNGHTVGITNTPAYGAIGSIFCQAYKSNQDVGICYIDRAASSKPIGDPILDWIPARYTRN
ncbi:MAG: hypothetical protein IKK42_03850 [Oscillospiraceae bacterium]|nr:hypothetical protein [Oscillospiraceae bacterium]